MSRGVVAAGALVAAAVCVAQVDGLKVAFLGDSETGENARRNYALAREAGADVMFQNGDFDYESDPELFDTFLDEELGDMLFLACSGNHDDETLSTLFSGGRKWEGKGGYKERFFDRYNEYLAGGNPGVNVTCVPREGKTLEEDFGSYMSCRVNNVEFVTIGWRQFSGSVLFSGGDRLTSQQFIESSLDATDALWKVLVTHRPDGNLNPGVNHVGTYQTQGDFNLAAKYGALLVHGHSHVYARSKLIDNFYSLKVSPNEDPFSIALNCGESASIINGMGGTDIDGAGIHEEASILTKIYTANSGNNQNGVVICDFTDEGAAGCEFIMQNGEVFDAFAVLAPPPSEICRNTTVEVRPISFDFENELKNFYLVIGPVGATLVVLTLLCCGVSLCCIVKRVRRRLMVASQSSQISNRKYQNLL